MQLDHHDDRLLELIDGVYATVEAPETWADTMARIAAWSDAPAIGVRFEYKQLGTLEQCWAGLPDAFHQLYVEGLWRSDPWAAAAAADDGIPVGLVVTGHDELKRVEPHLETAPFIHELLRPLGFSEVVGVVVRRDEACLFSLSALYERARSGTETQLRRAVGALAPHVGRAINLRHRLTERERIAAACGDTARVGVLVVDSALRLVSANTMASELLLAGTLMRIQNTRLQLASASHQARLLAVIGGTVVEDAIHVVSRGGGDMVMSIRRMFGSDRMLFRILVVDAADEGRWTGRILERAFGLTPAEARLAALVGRGASPAQAAESLNVAVSTARTQLLRVFDKLGVHRQSDLVRLVTRLSCLGAPT